MLPTTPPILLNKWAKWRWNYLPRVTPPAGIQFNIYAHFNWHLIYNQGVSDILVGLFSGNLFHIHMLFDIAAGSPSGTLFVFVACIFVSSDLLQTNLNNFTIAHVLTYFPLPYILFGISNFHNTCFLHVGIVVDVYRVAVLVAVYLVLWHSTWHSVQHFSAFLTDIILAIYFMCLSQFYLHSIRFFLASHLTFYTRTHIYIYIYT